MLVFDYEASFFSFSGVVEASFAPAVTQGFASVQTALSILSLFGILWQPKQSHSPIYYTCCSLDTISCTTRGWAVHLGRPSAARQPSSANPHNCCQSHTTTSQHQMCSTTQLLLCSNSMHACVCMPTYICRCTCACKRPLRTHSCPNVPAAVVQARVHAQVLLCRSINSAQAAVDDGQQVGRGVVVG